jgi:hypothetical protein
MGHATKAITVEHSGYHFPGAKVIEHVMAHAAVEAIFVRLQCGLSEDDIGPIELQARDRMREVVLLLLVQTHHRHQWARKILSVVELCFHPVGLTVSQI